MFFSNAIQNMDARNAIKNQIPSHPIILALTQLNQVIIPPITNKSSS